MKKDTLAKEKESASHGKLAKDTLENASKAKLKACDVTRKSAKSSKSKTKHRKAVDWFEDDSFSFG